MDMHQLLSTVQQTGTPRGENKGEEEAEEDDSSRMIDLPFRLFED